MHLVESTVSIMFSGSLSYIPEEEKTCSLCGGQLSVLGSYTYVRFNGKEYYLCDKCTKSHLEGLMVLLEV